MFPLDPPFDVAPLLALERERLLDVLRDLRAEQWDAPTPCPAWNVHQLVLHLVGDDLGVVSWLRDGHRGSAPPGGIDEPGFVAWLDQLQLDWVEAARRISPLLAVELLAWSGDELVRLVSDRDPSVVDGFVTWASDAPVPRWLDHGRELTEYWIHRQQLLEALGASSDLRADLFGPVMDTLVWAVPHGLRGVRPEPGGRIELRSKDDDNLWAFEFDGAQWRPVGDGGAEVAASSAARSSSGDG